MDGIRIPMQSDQSLEGGKMNQDTKTLLDEAKALIDEYCWVEFGNKTGADYSDLSAVGIGCTLDVDHEVQAQVNLVEYCIDTIVDDVLVRSEHYDDLGDLVKNGLSNLDFNVLMYVPDEELAALEKEQQQG
jgi:DNA (cytosine-5-)-methyltransferase